MMIQSLFVLSNSGEVVIEKHWRTVTPRSVCDFFWSEVNKFDNKIDVPPVMATPSHYLVSVYQHDIFLLATTVREANPLLIIEFLHRVAALFEEYFSSVDEDTLKDNFSLVYQLLEEMVDYGYALITEPSLLKTMIPPPSLVTQITQAVTFNTPASVVSDILPDSSLSNIPWRKTDVYYAQNEIYLDIVEEIDAIIDRNNHTVTSEAHGSIQAISKLSGTPDLLLTFSNPNLIDDCSFHPCVRYHRFEKERILSFIPPDGPFELMRYRVRTEGKIPIPIYCQPSVYLDSNSHTSPGTALATVSVTVGLKSQNSLILSNSSEALVVENVVVEIPFTKAVRTANLKVTVGNVLFDETSKIATWAVGKLSPGNGPQLTGSVLLSSTALNASGASSGEGTSIQFNESTIAPNVNLHWHAPQSSVSGLSIASLQLTNESYKPYKGMKSISKSGKVQVRAI